MTRRILEKTTFHVTDVDRLSETVQLAEMTNEKHHSKNEGSGDKKADGENEM